MTRKFQPLAGALLLFGALIFTSCGGDDEVVTPLDINNILTTWEFQTVEASDPTSSVGLSFMAPAIITFSGDDTYNAQYRMDSILVPVEGTWAYAGTTLTLDPEQQGINFELRELTNSAMVLYFNDTAVDPNSGQAFELDGAVHYAISN